MDIFGVPTWISGQREKDYPSYKHGFEEMVENWTVVGMPIILAENLVENSPAIKWVRMLKPPNNNGEKKGDDCHH